MMQSDKLKKYFSTLRISDDKTMELIDLYEQEECLWNTKHPNYRNKLQRSLAAKRIADRLNIDGFKAHHVMAKFKNLRNAYSQELKKIEKSEREGLLPYVPTVFWFTKMNSFIRPHLQAPRRGSAGRSQLGTVFLVNGNENWMMQPNPGEMLYLESNLNEEPTQVYITEVEETTPEDTSRSSSPTNKRPRTENETESSKTDQIIADSLKELSANVNALVSKKDDSFDCFGKYVAGLLRNLPPQRAWEVQPQIVNIITSAGLENCLNTSNRFTNKTDCASKGVGNKANGSLDKVTNKTNSTQNPRASDHDYSNVQIKYERDHDDVIQINECNVKVEPRED